MLKRLRDWFLARLVIVSLYLIACLPVRLAKGLAVVLGKLFEALMHRRRLIVEANMAVCFPDWDQQQQGLMRGLIFQSLGYSVYEIALAWCRRDSRHLPDCQIEGLEHINKAVEQGRGVLLVNGHFNCLEICSRYLAEAMPLLGVYRPFNNQYLERFQTQARLNYARKMISKRQPREIIAALKQKQIVWFAPDQDFGPQRSIFIPFFNRPAATLTATWRLARSTGAAVLTATPKRLKDGNYHIIIRSELPGVESDGPEELLRALNQRIETAVRESPQDYWWFHRRFKTTADKNGNIYS